MLQLNELNRDPLSPTTQAVSLHEVSCAQERQTNETII